MKAASIVFLIVVLGLTPDAAAQPAVEVGRESLQQIKGFYLTVDIEGSRGLTEEDVLDVVAIRRNVATRLAEAGLHVIEATEVVDVARVPNLYVHINMLDAGQGIVPFAINTQFYQEVRLAEQRLPTIASTWDTGLVGVVSYDTLELIGESAVTSVTNFIDDFRSANP